jgi:hypothetical protein
MTSAAIYDAVRIARFLVVPALDALTPQGVYWWVAPQTAVRPFVVVFSQDGGGVSVPRLGSQGWSGLVTVKAVADAVGVPNGNALAAAEALFAAVAPGMDAMTAPTNYDLSVRFVRPLALGPDAGAVWQYGGIWEVNLERE